MDKKGRRRRTSRKEMCDHTAKKNWSHTLIIKCSLASKEMKLSYRI